MFLLHVILVLKALIYTPIVEGSALESAVESANYGSESVGSNTRHGLERFKMQ